MGHDVFLSFSSKDQQIADSVYKYLTDHNIGCWYSPTSIDGGGRYYEDIVDAIQECKILVLIYTSSALDSKYIVMEVDRAINYDKRIIPYKIENVALNKKFEFLLSSYQSIDVSASNIDENTKLQRLLESVNKNLETLKKMDKSHTGTSLPASTVGSSLLTTAEEKYRDGLKKALEDAQITQTERAKLDGLLDGLNISPERAKELEEQVKMELSPKPQTDAEQKYVTKLKTALQGGQISEIERAKLEGFLEAVDLSPERAKELEELVKNEIELAIKQAEKPVEAISEEVDYDERYNNRDIAYKLAEELNQKYSEQLGKLGVEFAVSQPRQTESAFVYCYFPLGELGFSLEAWVSSKEIGMWAHGSNQASRDFGKKWFETNCKSINAGAHTGDGYFLELWKVEYPNKTDRDSREQQFKEKVFGSLDSVFPELSKTSVVLETIKEFIDNLVSALTQEFPSNEGWEVMENAKSLAPWMDIYVYKSSWKRDNLDRPSVLSYAIECSDWNFDNLFFGIGKGVQNINIPNDLADSLYKELTDKLGEGEKDGWWVYWRYPDEKFRFTGGAEFSLKITSKEIEDKYTRYYVDIFRKMKEVAPLIDELVSKA